ncbi:MAG: hypothetical protein NWE92_02645 [Candidatus Bathyarchaeota archaeon]|nr:hypothetical protein [Candidatus Bathyarchaeota archaeon]
MEPKLIIIFTSLFGFLVGIYFLPIASPQLDFAYWLPLFGLIGLIGANILFIIVRDVIKKLAEPPQPQKPQQE